MIFRDVDGVFFAADCGGGTFFTTKSAFRTDCGCPAFMEDQAIHVVREIGQRQFGFCPFETDGADEQTEAVFLMGENMLDPCADG